MRDFYVFIGAMSLWVLGVLAVDRLLDEPDSHCPVTQQEWDMAYILHQFWLNGDSVGERMDLRGCDLRHLEIRDPIGCDLQDDGTFNCEDLDVAIRHL